MTLFASLLHPVSRTEPALAFHVKSMRAAQFIKLARQNPKWRIFGPSISSLNFGRPKGIMAWGLADPLTALVDDIFVSPPT